MRRMTALTMLGLSLLTSSAFAQSTLQDPEASLTVTGSRERPSNWRQAETDHVIVLSDGSEKELLRIAHNLERLHFLLSVLLNRIDKPDDTMKLRVTLVGDGAEFDAMDLRNLRSREGPYTRAFAARRYYDPREDGAVMAVSRLDQKAVLERAPPVDLPSLVRATTAAAPSTPGQRSIEMPGQAGILANSQAGAMTSFGKDNGFSVSVSDNSVPVSAEGRIYAGFAQHYLLTNFPNAYPRWYVDGFGELFATIVARDDGEIEYGRPPAGYRQVFDQYARYPIGEVLSGRYLTDKRTTERWTPFHAWALTHILFFSNERRGQLHAYLATIAAGGSMDKAALAFGDLATLQRDMAGYENRKVAFERMTYPADRDDAPIVRRLSEGQAAFLKGRLELGARVDLPPPDSDTQMRFAAIRERDAWLGRLRREAGHYRTNLEAQLLLAEAECRSGNAAQCVGAADQALAIEPDNSDALAWKGTGQVQLALAAPDRASQLKAARATIARANRINTENPLPLLAYYRSYADAGEPAPDVAIEGLRKAIEIVPAAPGPRLMLGEALARRGDPGAARRALIPVANSAYDSPEAQKARTLLATLAG